MKAPGGTAPAVKKPVTTSTMKRVGPPRPRKVPQLVAPSSNTEALIETLRERVNDLEARIADLESVISLQNQDVIISAPKSVLIQGQDTVEVSAGSKVIVSASLSETNAAVARFSGIVECDVLKANTVISASYTPGAGNIW
ncbi:hypothetical protein [Roseibium sediminicola]|uniref:Uncharacterized protein n=1 Tax=Roseibium sediminicola TaxID=2933272 RepID=A0ABT0GQ43_9HYPH|nr:hypothetical protein [Roseibium sp. CAU 1639]MCK7611543.1 hypothetical protein [Roseibium sp. CAU 1639]